MALGSSIAKVTSRQSSLGRALFVDTPINSHWISAHSIFPQTSLWQSACHYLKLANKMSISTILTPTLTLNLAHQPLPSHIHSSHLSQPHSISSLMQTILVHCPWVIRCVIIEYGNKSAYLVRVFFTNFRNRRPLTLNIPDYNLTSITVQMLYL
jgi:hypothetical protein